MSLKSRRLLLLSTVLLSALPYFEARAAGGTRDGNTHQTKAATGETSPGKASLRKQKDQAPPSHSKTTLGTKVVSAPKTSAASMTKSAAPLPSKTKPTGKGVQPAAKVPASPLKGNGGQQTKGHGSSGLGKKVTESPKAGRKTPGRVDGTAKVKATAAAKSKAIETQGKIKRKEAKKDAKIKKDKVSSVSSVAPLEKTEREAAAKNAQDEHGGGWLPMLLGIIVVAGFAFGTVWYRKKQGQGGIESPATIPEGDAPLSTFVSNITEIELDSSSSMAAPLAAADRTTRGRKDKAPTKGSQPVVRADPGASQETPPNRSHNGQKIATDPPSSGAPSQIIIPRKSRPPVAS